MALLHGLSIVLEELGLDEAGITALKKALPESAIYSGKKTYLKVTVSINDKVDKYGNNVSAWLEQSQEERDEKKDKKFIGNGKVFWQKGETKTAKDLANDTDSSDDIPF